MIENLRLSFKGSTLQLFVSAKSVSNEGELLFEMGVNKLDVAVLLIKLHEMRLDHPHVSHLAGIGRS